MLNLIIIPLLAFQPIVLDEYLNLKGVYPLGQDINGYILMPCQNEFGKFTKLK